MAAEVPRALGRVAAAGLEARGLRVRLTGATDGSVAGAVREQSIAIEGSGDYRAERLASERARIVISGSGSARVSAAAGARGGDLGAGEVACLGEPRVRQRITGAGSVERAAR